MGSTGAARAANAAELAFATDLPTGTDSEVEAAILKALELWSAKGVLVTIVWSGVVSLIAYKVVDMVIGLRVSEEDEREGLDITSHGESAYGR